MIDQIRTRLQADPGVRVSGQTIRNQLHARRPRVIPCLRDRHIRARRQWCQDRHWLIVVGGIYCFQMFLSSLWITWTHVEVP